MGGRTETGRKKAEEEHKMGKKEEQRKIRRKREAKVKEKGRGEGR